MDNTTTPITVNSTMKYYMTDIHLHVFHINNAASVLLIVLYICIFLVSLVGNCLALIVLMRVTGSREGVVKNLYLINLVIADLSGEYINSSNT